MSATPPSKSPLYSRGGGIAASGAAVSPATFPDHSSESNATPESDSRESVSSANGRYGARNLSRLLQNLPDSPKDLLARIDRQRDEIRLLHEENNRLKAREVEVSSLVLRLQQQFQNTQSQIGSIKLQIQTQLSQPVSEAEYNRINELPEDSRDIIDTIKLGIFRQIGSLKAAADAATRRTSELSLSVQTLTEQNSDLKLQLAESKAVSEAIREDQAEKLRKTEKNAARVVELEKTVEALESRLKAAHIDQEQFLSSKLQSQCKTDEVARLGVRLEEAEMNVERYRASAECAEQKLDILKSEYYELKLRHSQRILELESCLRASEEKLKSLRDLEQESELYIMNIASQPGSPSTSLEQLPLDSWYALPQSRKIAHTLSIAKRYLQMQNRVHMLEHEADLKNKQMSRLQVSLDAARDALHNINSPYVMVEKTLNELQETNDALTEKNTLLAEEVRVLQESLEERMNEIQLLCGHRRELLKMKKLIQEFGIQEGIKQISKSTAEADRKATKTKELKKEEGKVCDADSETTDSLPMARKHPITSYPNMKPIEITS